MFRDRTEAGERLADRLTQMGLEDPVVYALPRGGLPVALPVARRLGAPLDLLLVRKIGVPGHEELAAGAVVDGDVHEVVFNDEVLRTLGLRAEDFGPAVKRKLAEIEERRRTYLAGRTPVPVEGRAAIVVDDGIATGATMRAALKGLRARKPKAIVLAVPVAPPETIESLRRQADDVVCLETPTDFWAVGAHYRDFRQVTDEEVAAMMAEARR